MKVKCSKANPLLGGLIAIEFLREGENVEMEWTDTENSVEASSKIQCETNNEMLRALARTTGKLNGDDLPQERTAVDHWLTVALSLTASPEDYESNIAVLDRALGASTYLAAKRLTIADLAVFASLYSSKLWQNTLKSNQFLEHVVRWFKFIKSQPCVSKALSNLPADIKSMLTPADTNRPVIDKTSNVGNRAREGKFIDLPGAEMGKVVVRFPPEASGYLHIGHAKAALLNQYYQQAFDGKLIMRFDDTNPAKEDLHFEKVILEDVELLEIKPDMFTHTSQYFELMLELCEKLLKDGKAYVDNTEPELMKTQREQKIESANRSNSVDENFKLWQEMKLGTELGQKCCVRAKIDMQSPNGCLRDPTIYRCKPEPHPKTGLKYKVYPTYDFACPIVDSIEGVTHVLRTMEYHDRDPQFFWFIEALGLRKPHIWEYSRLSMTNTVLSKRKLTWFVQERLVDGWDDPRMPTVRGVLRRGMTVQGLKEFIIAQGSSRSVVFMEWDKIWAFNKKVIDPIAPRYTALSTDTVVVNVNGAKEECLTVPKHPKNNDIGTKSVWIGPKILIDRVDAELLKENENATFINWGNLMIKKINRENKVIKSIDAVPNLDNKDYKKTVKLTWLAETANAKPTPTFCVYYNHIISKALLGKDEDFKQYIGHETRKEVQMVGDPELKNLKKGDIIQLQRIGFFRVDVAYVPLSLFTCKAQAVILIFIPDGSNNSPVVFDDNKSAAAVNAAVEKKIERKPKQASPPAVQSGAKSAASINEEIVKQGDVVRNLKSQKAPKAEIDQAVKGLLSLKAEYKSATNTEWKPGCVPPSSATSQVVISNADRSAEQINAEIVKQGNLVRDLKAQKAAKDQIDAAVKNLLSLKAEYKSATNTEWKPGCVPPPSEVTPAIIPSGGRTAEQINAEIVKQGDLVRNLKGQKAAKDQIDAAVKVLLSLKAEYKSVTNTEWKPGCSPPAAVSSTPQQAENSLLESIAKQGDKVRELKSAKAEKKEVEAQVKILLELKAEFKKVTGKDWKPDMKASCDANVGVSAPAANDAKTVLTNKITEQGNIVRNLKTNKAAKEEVDKAVKLLLDLKAEYKTLTGTDFPVAGRQSSGGGNKQQEKAPKKKAAIPPKEKSPPSDDSALKKQTRLGLEARKEENLSDWYSQIITKGEMIEYYDVSGCYIFRPWSFAIWESIKEWFDQEIKKLGVQNCYFPIFVSKSVLEKEKTHIADFAPEVAWVTKSGDSDMAEPIAVRPTSETVMYPAYAKWIQSYRDLPIKLNQWNNVVRWEFKHPQPFLRTREFLWQEGHTAYALKEEADVEVKTILDLYAQIYTDLLAIPVVKGRKTEKEKFAGGDYTLTVEAFVSASGRAIQGATSHHLGQNFSKMFDIIYEDPETQEKKFVYQNSWGITTRTIGVMIMIHADNQGLVLPPRVASIQIVIVPCGITANLSESGRNELQKSCDALEAELVKVGVKAKGDYRANYSPGWKFNHWELKGVPIRVELGPKDIEKNQLVAVRRDTGEKVTIPRGNAAQKLKELLNTIQSNLLQKATDDLNQHKVLLQDWSQFSANLDKKNIILAPFCGNIDCEDRIKADSARNDDEASEPGAPSMGAKSLCIPLEQPAPIQSGDKCIHPACKNKPVFYTLFGRSY